MHRKSPQWQQQQQQLQQHQQQAIFHKRIICKGPRVICLCFVPYARALSSGFPSFIVPIVLSHVFFSLCCFSFCCRFYLLLLFWVLFECVCVCLCFYNTPSKNILCLYKICTQNKLSKQHREGRSKYIYWGDKLFSIRDHCFYTRNREIVCFSRKISN